jgi:uncharacterized metal-binding protein YceD (DUF177 family)
MLSSTDFHGEFSALRVATSEIGPLGLTLDKKISAEAFNALVLEPNNDFCWSTEEGFAFFGRVEKESEDSFKVSVKATIKANVACVRCFKPLSYLIDLSFSVRMIHEDEASEDTDFLEQSSFSQIGQLDSDQEIAVTHFVGNKIDLGIIVREQFFFSVPDYPRCNDAQAEPKRTCAADVLLKSSEAQRENPFVKFFKKN